jgi:Flp pilus assembly protein CpaB
MEMKSVLLAAVTGLTMCAGVAVTSAQDVVISPEQDTVIREYVQKKPLASVSVPGVELNIGSTLPETVELHTFEDVPDMKYQYVVVDNKTVLVEPGTRKIVKVYN